MNSKPHLLDMTCDSLKADLLSIQQPAWRADQILKWVYEQRAGNWDKMSNLSKTLREIMMSRCTIYSGAIRQVHECSDGTQKLLIQWEQDEYSEAVLMREANRHTVCVSTQIGCPVGCGFCASGQTGLQRSLTAGEIVEQVLHAASLLNKDERISHIVLMGMGEPFLNYEASLQAMRTLNAGWGMKIASRHITVSTIGLPERIRLFGQEPEQFTLAVSLHAPDDALRAKLIPWAQKYRLAEIFDAIDDYYHNTHREVTLEYVLLAEVNSSPHHARQLADLIGKSRCNVNVINYNKTPGSPFDPVSPTGVKSFVEALKNAGINAHLRKSKGSEIEAACGQLRSMKIKMRNEG